MGVIRIARGLVTIRYSHNLRVITEYARKEPVTYWHCYRYNDGARIVIIYYDRAHTTCTFGSYEIAVKWLFSRKWGTPYKIATIPEQIAAIYLPPCQRATLMEDIKLYDAVAINTPLRWYLNES